MHSHTVLQARIPKSRCLRGHTSSKVSKEESFLASSSFWGVQHSLACGSITSPSFVVSFLLLLKGHVPLDLWTILIQDESQLNIPNLVTSAKTFFQISSYSQVPAGHILGGITNLSHSLILMSPMKLVTWIPSFHLSPLPKQCQDLEKNLPLYYTSQIFPLSSSKSTLCRNLTLLEEVVWVTLGNEIELQEDKGDPGLLSESVSFLQDKDHSMETRVSPLSTLSSETESEKQEDVCCCCSVTRSYQLLATPWTAACQASTSFTIFWNLLKLMSIKSMISSNHLILCCPLLLLLSIFPSTRVFSKESALHIR